MKWIKLFEDWNLMESLASAREKYVKTNQISDEEFNLIKDLDPSKNFKYVEKMIDVYLKDSPNLEELGKAFRDFDEMSKKNQLKNSDITSYRSFSEIINTTQRVFSEYKEKIETKAKANEIDVVYEDDRVLVLIPRTHEAVCKYGSGTKWCITEENQREYLYYKRRLITHYFIILKAFPTSDPNYKMAVNVSEDGKFECNDSLDNSIPIEKVLEISGLDKGLFIPSPSSLPPDVELQVKLGVKLGDAINKQNSEYVKKYLQMGASPNGFYGDDKELPLFDAISFDNTEIVNILLEAGVNLDVKNEYNLSPLFWCIYQNSVKSAEILINAGIDLEVTNDGNLTPLNLAVEKSNPIIVELLIDAGANVETSDYSGNSPLHRAARYNERACAELLISGGADISAKNDNDFTPLHVAVEGDRIEIARLLINAWIDEEVEDYDMDELLDLTESPEMQELLRKLNKML